MRPRSKPGQCRKSRLCAIHRGAPRLAERGEVGRPPADPTMEAAMQQVPAADPGGRAGGGGAIDQLPPSAVLVKARSVATMFFRVCCLGQAIVMVRGHTDGLVGEPPVLGSMSAASLLAILQCMRAYTMDTARPS